MTDVNQPEHFDELNEDKKCALMEFCNSLDKIKSLIQDILLTV